LTDAHSLFSPAGASATVFCTFPLASATAVALNFVEQFPRGYLD